MPRANSSDVTLRRRSIGLGCALLTAIASAATVAFAQQASPTTTTALSKASVCEPSRTLGVSRVIDIDTAQGGRFGHQQYKEAELLSEGEVILTFDDGPLRIHTQAVVNALEQQCTKATFFMVGSQAAADPDMVRQIARKGHTVGTHTWSHANLRKMTPMSARQEIELGFSAVTLAAGQPIAPFFRFPFLADTRAMIGYTGTRHLGVFSIEVDALDYRNKHNPQAVHDQVMSQLAYQKKGIVLFHDIQPSTAQALPMILRSLKAKGYRVVHLKPAAAATTVAEFDTMARRHFEGKRIAVAKNPLADRAMTWTMPPKSDQSLGAGGSPIPGGVVAATARLPARVTTQPGAMAPAPGPGMSPAAAGSPYPGVAPYPVPALAAGGPLPPPVYIRPTRPRPEDDWRRAILNRD